MVQYLAKLKPEEFLRRYLRVAPLALAIFRSIEAKNIAEVAMRRPILDLGCGFGEFAGVFFQKKVEMGLDISWDELVSAQKANLYEKLTWADASDLPFKDNHFGTVLSVSVLEHIPNVGPVLDEAFRVLKPGGKFVLTVNGAKINKLLFWPNWFKKRGLPGLGTKYLNWYHRVFKHQTLWSKRKWEQALKKVGFKISHSREIISPEATQLFDFFLLTAWPSQIIKLLIGYRWAWRPKWFREWLVKKYAWIVEREEKQGSNLFIVATK
ncbi:methyltransferase domain-containing protein [Patescibacteria group bacterium]